MVEIFVEFVGHIHTWRKFFWTIKWWKILFGKHFADLFFGKSNAEIVNLIKIHSIKIYIEIKGT